MTVILTGPRRSGKTTLLRVATTSWMKRGLSFGGILSPAVGPPGDVSGYDILDLKTGETGSFLRKDGCPDWEKAGRFSIMPGAVAAASEILLRVPPGEPVVMDEAGPLELQGRGLWPAAARLLAAPSKPLLIVIRDGLLARFRLIPGLERAAVVSAGDPDAIAEISKRLFP